MYIENGVKMVLIPSPSVDMLSILTGTMDLDDGSHCLVILQIQTGLEMIDMQNM